MSIKQGSNRSRKPLALAPLKIQKKKQSAALSRRRALQLFVRLGWLSHLDRHTMAFGARYDATMDSGGTQCPQKRLSSGDVGSREPPPAHNDKMHKPGRPYSYA
mmetsp:Transcript_64717/g.186101  ORF Transcript_64717/g.186101 Transcript_64717/m.186101 type:complete len:104 (+) Transcript_64717:538-849(+)